MKGKLRWKLGEKETGLSAIGACHRGYILHDGEEEFARIYPNGGGWKSDQSGWYWTANVGDLRINTCGNPVAEIDQAKRDARAYVDKALKEQPPMTDRIQQARRAAFEADLIRKNPGARLGLSKHAGGSYRNMYAQAGWDGFNAALDSLCIELPLMDCIVDEDGFMHDVMRAEDVRAAIKQTNMGITIK